MPDDKMWTGYPDPRHLGPYDARYQSERYDKAMFCWGVEHYAGWPTAEAWYLVTEVMRDIDKQKHQEFVKRSVC